MGGARPSASIRPAVVWRLHEDLVAEGAVMGGAWGVGGAYLTAPHCPQRGTLTGHRHDISGVNRGVLRPPAEASYLELWG